MLKIAIIQFPGLNTEYETRREIERAGMQGEFFRWNEAPSKLAKYDGYVIGGGFSYEDRGRAGVIAAHDLLMEALKVEADKGKPVLGICNGAQILVEAGLIPGADGHKLAMSLARNKRIRDGEVLGTGYYNAWVNLKCVVQEHTNLFTWNFREGAIVRAPIAHGEGRFTTEMAELMSELQENNQLVFRYCDENGAMTESFPVNPNGAMFNAAAICNPAGNVMAIMPHLERDLAASHLLFTSIRDALTAKEKSGAAKKRAHHLNVKPLPAWPLPAYQTTSPKSLEFYISMNITDNEAETLQSTLANLGWPQVQVKRTTHVEFNYEGKPDLKKLSKKLVQTGTFLNTNKESVHIKAPKESSPEENHEGFSITKILVREKSDYVGLSKLGTLKNRLKINEIADVHMGIVWEIAVPTKSAKVAQDTVRRIMDTHLFWNPHRQSAWVM